LIGPPVPDDQGRVVVVAAGFALWRGGRCIAAARWGDLRRLRAYRLADSLEIMRLGVELVDGTVMELQEHAPGFDLFLDRGAVVLGNALLPFAAWGPTLASAPDGVVIYEKKALGGGTKRRTGTRNGDIS
jgi:hypothetical protein